MFFRKQVPKPPKIIKTVAAQTTTTAHVEEPVERDHKEIKFIMVALMLALLLGALDQTIVSTALPQIASDLHGLTKLSWVATAYLLTSAIVTPIYGKLGDMYGRKKIFITAITIFLIGSVLCGIAQDMSQLVIFRGIQGLGGGGLMALILAIIGDLVPPRQRGRYQGYFGAVFGLSSVAGPLLGGLFTQHLDWRWIFFINIPLGLFTLYAISTRLHLPKKTTEHRIDYIGVALLSSAVGALMLVSVWAGVDYAWSSSQIISLIAASIILTISFALWERKAKEPLMPLRLFKSSIFNVSSGLSFFAGIAMFASILYIPMYQQVVRGNSPTESGLLMIPLMIGIITATTISGKIISKTGSYRKFPIIGSVFLGIGLYLFSHISLTTSHVMMSIWMIMIGLGLGMMMQIPTLAVQNAARRQDLGVATSTVMFFRGIGSALGGAIFGTILTSRMASHISESLGNNAASAGQALAGGSAQIAQLPSEAQHAVLQAYVSSFHDMFLYALPFAVILFLLALLLRDMPLRQSTREQPAAENLQASH